MAGGVVLVDDNPLHIRVLEVVLAERGIEVVASALDGEEGVQVVEDAQPRFVVMDLQMPRMDGITATSIITAQWPEIEVLAYTSTVNADVRARFLEAGARTVFDKGEHYALVDYVRRRIELG